MKNYTKVILTLILSSSVFSCTTVKNSDTKISSKFSVKDLEPLLDDFNEEAYLLAFDDIKYAVKNGNLSSGYQHYLISGRNEGRLNTQSYIYAKQAINDGFNEEAYLLAFDDIKYAVKNGNLSSGYQHYLWSGKSEARLTRQDYIQALAFILAGNTPVETGGGVIKGRIGD